MGKQEVFWPFFITIIILALIMGAAFLNLGGNQGFGGVLSFRNYSPGVSLYGLILLFIFLVSVPFVVTAMVTGGKSKNLVFIGDLLVKINMLLAVIFMFCFPFLPQLENKSLTLRAVLYPTFILLPFIFYKIKKVSTPFPLLFDLLISFIFTYDIVSNDLHWYDNWEHYDDFIHFLNSVPFMLVIMFILISLKKAGRLGLGIVGLIVFGLSLYISGHTFWEIWEFSMDHYTGTRLQPGGMSEATRNNLSGVAGAIIGSFLIWWWEKRLILNKAVEETKDYLVSIGIIK